MAKFLIYNKSHWMELPSKSEPTKTGYKRNEDIINSKFISTSDKLSQLIRLEDKRNYVEIQGDIVKVKPDEYKMCGKEPLSFVLISVPELTYKDALQYQGPLMEGSYETGLVLKKKSRCNLDISGINLNKDKEAIIQLTTFMEKLTVRK